MGADSDGGGCSWFTARLLKMVSVYKLLVWNTLMNCNIRLYFVALEKLTAYGPYDID